ncbi:hypothetical protein [Paenibacillus sp. GYB003]|uniref:hypothetical protein n=1 Tax=Paenibacillus sp. GYB003 TaxID=2994392 RepID=UPI002F96A426
MSEHALFGYDPRKVKRYMERLESKAEFLERKQRGQRETFLSKQAGLLRQIAEAERELAELETMEANLKQWIRRNRSSV